MTDADYDALLERERKLWLDMQNLQTIYEQTEKQWEDASEAIIVANRLRDKLQAQRRREALP